MEEELTSQQESGAVGAKLSPEGREEVDELEGGQPLLAGQGWVDCSGNVEQDADSCKPKQLQPETTNPRVVNDGSCQPVTNQGNSTVQQSPQKSLLQVCNRQSQAVKA